MEKELCYFADWLQRSEWKHFEGEKDSSTYTDGNKTIHISDIITQFLMDRKEGNNG